MGWLHLEAADGIICRVVRCPRRWVELKVARVVDVPCTALILCLREEQECQHLSLFLTPEQHLSHLLLICEIGLMRDDEVADLVLLPEVFLLQLGLQQEHISLLLLQLDLISKVICKARVLPASNGKAMFSTIACDGLFLRSARAEDFKGGERTLMHFAHPCHGLYAPGLGHPRPACPPINAFQKARVSGHALCWEVGHGCVASPSLVARERSSTNRESLYAFLINRPKARIAPYETQKLKARAWRKKVGVPR